jgi:EAL domain-containing protein (putative c-di-GMP-specific phosphodiesterase class I)
MTKIGYEFLARSAIDHFRMPDEFFRISMENNVLTLVDRQCLRTCLEASISLEPGMHCHMNLFPSTMIEVPVRQLLEDFPADRPKSTYCIEISEQQIIGDPLYLAKPVAELKRSGMQVAIDDVGFGRSCLENLIHLEPDIIKIDKRCVRGVSTDLQRARWLKRIVDVANVLETEVVAEGIETEEELAIVKDLGVAYGQGFLLEKPLAAKEVVATHS